MTKITKYFSSLMRSTNNQEINNNSKESIMKFPPAVNEDGDSGAVFNLIANEYKENLPCFQLKNDIYNMHSLIFTTGAPENKKKIFLPLEEF